MGTPALNSLEGGDAHDEVINELDGNGVEASIDVGVPLGVNDKVFFGGLDVVGVEDDLAEVDVGDLDVVVEGYVPLVVGLVYDLGVYVELHRFRGSCPDPQTGHKYDNEVAAVGTCEFCEVVACCLRGVVDCVCIVP